MKFQSNFAKEKEKNRHFKLILFEEKEMKRDILGLKQSNFVKEKETKTRILGVNFKVILLGRRRNKWNIEA